jgi:MraZ protein
MIEWGSVGSAGNALIPASRQVDQAKGGEARVMFVGAHERQLDDKGRVALPATYRAHLGEHCYLVKGTDKCVEVIPSEAFEQFGKELIAKVERGELTLNRQRALASSAVLATVDKQGRVNVDEKLRSYAELALDSSIVVAGNFTRLEIWSPERYARVDAEGTDDIAGDPV